VPAMHATRRPAVAAAAITTVGLVASIGARASAVDTGALPAQLSAWHAVPLEGATCGGPDRAQYEYFLNEASEQPVGILVALAGGGVCMRSGLPPEGVTGTAAELYCMEYGNFHDPFFNETTFATDLAPAAAVPFFRRSDPANPFRDYDFVAVPYCTGDLHAGSMTEPFDYDPSPQGTFEVLHRGHLNVEAVVEDVHARVPADVPVVLTGFSAGAFGAIYNFPTVVARWPRTRVLADAGTSADIRDSLTAREADRLVERWAATQLLPDYCQERECLTSTLHLLAAHAKAYDGRHGRQWLPFGLLQGQQDATLSAFLEVSQCTYELALTSALPEALAADNLRAFVPATTQHVFGVVNPLAERYRSLGGVDPIVWAGQVGSATSAAELPPSAVDPWMPCNQLLLPAGWAPSR
jgi:hypothetical protein